MLPANVPSRIEARFCRSPAAKAPMGAVVLPFAQVPRQAHEKEAGGAGVTTQASRVQKCTAKRSAAKGGGVHRRWDLPVSPIRSARGCTVFIIVDFSSSYGLHLVTGGRLRAGVAVRHGVFTPYTESSNCLIVALDSWRAVEGKCIPENRARVRPEFGIQHETKVDQVVTTICRGVAQTPEARCAGELAFGA